MHFNGQLQKFNGKKVIFLKVNVTIYKDLNLEFVPKKSLVTRTQCENAV